MNNSVLLIYTGGTIGMIKDSDTGALRSFDFDELLHHIPEIKQLACQITTYSFPEPLDSSDMQISDWKNIGDVIHENYDKHSGFVVLHGSDTMSFTASALSFMFENLGKPIIFTGSQLPIGDLRTDAKENLITAIQLASQQDQNDLPLIKEVCIYFEYQLYRANRTTKNNAEHFEAFASPNLQPLAISGVNLKIHKSILWNKENNIYAFAKAINEQEPSTDEIYTYRYRPELVNEVVILKLFPGISEATVQSICGIPGLKGIILETYGSGNAPTMPWFNRLIAGAIENDIRVVNVSQCNGGSVNMTKYITGIHLLRLGGISGYDMTTEAALAKMMYLLYHTDSYESFKMYFETPLRGELTLS